MMTQILLVSRTIACFSILHICSLTKESSRTTFELYFGESHDTVTSFFHKSFHQCSLDADCNFVAKNKKTNSFKKYSHEGNLPKNRKTHLVFKKRLINFEKESEKTEFDPQPLYVGCYNDRRARALAYAKDMEQYGAIGMTEQCIKNAKVKVIHMLDYRHISAFVVQNIINMEQLLNRAVLKPALTILAECAEVTGKTLSTDQAKKGMDLSIKWTNKALSIFH